VGGAFVGQAVGMLVGARLHGGIPMGPLRSADRGVGAAIGAAGVVVSVWLLLPSMANVPGSIAIQVRQSAIAKLIDEKLPRPPNTLQALKQLVGKDNFPRVFEGLGDAPAAGPPPAASGLDGATAKRVEASTVRVEGQACDRLQDGSGFAAAPETIVTNAHVVAGERRTYVFRPDGTRLPATVVVFDSDRDLAVLRVPGLNQAPLAIGAGKVGANGAVFGHPNGVAQVVVAPATISREVDAVGRDLYDTKPTTRDVYILASDLHPCESGGPLVDTAGDVVGVAFAIAPDRPGTAYALTTKELNPVLAQPRGAAVSTGPCISND